MTTKIKKLPKTHTDASRAASLAAQERQKGVVPRSRPAGETRDPRHPARLRALPDAGRLRFVTHVAQLSAPSCYRAAASASMQLCAAANSGAKSNLFAGGV